MKLTVNGDEHDLAAADLAEALRLLELDSAVVATALNGAFVPAASRAATALEDGDRIEIVSPRQGG
ncbi:MULTISPECIES: sulfur carrier protein ThiS [Methylopila]|uniref:Thiamine biosynthesis protein ThiS n=2 Tax=Methylopila TaxID=61653 RepID=A0A9W6N4U1_9HYPH|nr:sulfur carrier protein ThiS [Methylopila turkensis]GLK78489.1 thiamine biosynthesis protein ThiS [Methylopila turkensis]